MSRSLLLVACLVMGSFAAAGAAEVRLVDVLPTALVTREAPPRQQVVLSIENPGAASAGRLEVRSKGTTLASAELSKIGPGKQELTVLLPEPTKAVEAQWVLVDAAGKTLAEKTKSWNPPRHWTLYVLKSAHVDIGLHDSQYKQRHSTVGYIDLARKLAQQTADWPEASRFRYVVEGAWWWSNYPGDRGEAATDAIVKELVAPGIFGIGASHSGNHTQEFGTEELCRSAYYARHLRDRWSAPADTMFMIDNNGITWPLVTVYADAGIRYLGFFPNAWRSRVNVGWESEVPHLFYWEGPDAKSRLLVWSGPHYISTGHSFGIQTCSRRANNPCTPEDAAPKLAHHLARLEARYPYDVWLVSNYDDNEVPNLRFPELARAWNAKWRWPEMRTVGDPAVPFREVEKRFGDRIPTLRGDVTGGWAQHPVSTPAYLAKKREADRLMTTAEKAATIARLVDPKFVYPTEAFRRAWDALICSDEHGYGVSPYKGRTVYETWMQKRDWIDRALATARGQSQRAVQALAAQVPTDGPAVLVFNPLLQSRSDLVTVTLPEGMGGDVDVVRSDTGQPVAAQVVGRELQLLAGDVPSLGYVTFRLRPGKRGKLVAEAAAAPPVLENDFYRLTFAADGSIAAIFDKELKRELLDPAAPYRFNQFVFTRDDHKTFATPAGATFTVVSGPLGQTVTARMEEPISGAAITQSVTLPKHEKRIDVDNRLEHVAALVPADSVKYLRYGYYAFPLAVPGGVFRAQLNGCTARPHDDQVAAGTEEWMAVQDWVDLSNDEFGITVVQRESHLFEFGEIRTNQRTAWHAPKTTHLYSYLFNDWYQKNWIGPDDVNLRYRYSIRSHRGDCREGRAAQFAGRVAYPMLAAAIGAAQPGKLPAASHSFLQLDAANVELLTLKPSDEPGRGLIARLHETQGVGVEKAAMTQRLAADLATTACSVVEEDRGPLDPGGLAIGPFDFATIRLAPKSAALPAPEVQAGEVSDKSVTLTWKAVAGAQQYNVFRGRTADFRDDAGHLLGSTTATALTDDWLAPGTAYCYRVAAVGPVNRQGESSAVVSVATAAAGDSPPAPVGTQEWGLISRPRAWRGDRDDTLYLLWGQNRESDVACYELYRGQSPDFTADEKTLVAKVEPGPYVVVPHEETGLKPHTTYYYRVRAVDRDGHRGELSPAWSGTTRDVAPARQ